MRGYRAQGYSGGGEQWGGGEGGGAEELDHEGLGLMPQGPSYLHPSTIPPTDD